MEASLDISDTQAANDTAPRATIRDYIVVLAAMIAGHLGPLSQPYQVGALLGTGAIDEQMAGLFLGVEIACYAATLMLVARLVGRINLRTLALVGAAVSLAAFAITGMVAGGAATIPMAAVIGIGQGMIFATSIAAAARTGEPERVVGLAGMVVLIFFGGFMLITPIVQEQFGQTAVFGELAVVLALVAAPLLLIPTEGATESTERGRFDGAVILFLLQLFLYGAASGSIYAFMEQMGLEAGVAPRPLGVIMMLGILFGAGGSAAASKVGASWGHTLPLVLALVAVGVAAMLTASGINLWVFLAGVTLYQIFYSFAFPYLLGAAITLSGGALASFAGGLLFLASALGSTAAGWIVHASSYRLLGVIALLACLLAALITPRRLRQAPVPLSAAS